MTDLKKNEINNYFSTLMYIYLIYQCISSVFVISNLTEIDPVNYSKIFLSGIIVSINFSFLILTMLGYFGKKKIKPTCFYLVFLYYSFFSAKSVAIILLNHLNLSQVLMPILALIILYVSCKQLSEKHSAPFLVN